MISSYQVSLDDEQDEKEVNKAGWGSAGGRCCLASDNLLAKYFPLPPYPVSIGYIVFWSVVTSYYSYETWNANAAAENPFSMLWIACTIITVSSEAWSNRLLSITKENNRRIDLICQFILFVLYELYIGLSITMVVLTHLNSVNSLVPALRIDSLLFFSCLALGFLLMVSISLNHLAYFDYTMRKKRFIQKLRQRNYLVLVSFSYTLRLLSIALLVLTIPSIWSADALISLFITTSVVMPMMMFALFDLHNEGYIDVLFGKETKWSTVIGYCMFAIGGLMLLSLLYVVCFVGLVDKSDDNSTTDISPSEITGVFTGFFPFFCWIMFVSIVRRSAVQQRIDDQYLQFVTRANNFLDLDADGVHQKQFALKCEYYSQTYENVL